MTKKYFLTICFLGAIFSLAGCSISFKGKETTDLGGIYVSGNKGDTWVRKNAVPTPAGNASIGALNCSVLELDPGDSGAVYFGSVQNGLYFSYDNTNAWQKAGRLGDVTVNAIAVDPNNKCNIYIASANKVYKSSDCNRSWREVYFDNNPLILVNAIAIDHYNTDTIYIATDRGEVIKSVNQGESWQTVGRFEDKVKKLAINPADSRIIFAGAERNGIFRSLDAGNTWENLNERLSKFEKKFTLRDLTVTPAKPGYIILTTVYGMFESNDNGNTWEKINLITPEKEAIINSVAISPKNEKAIYYITNTTFYRSTDGGANWSTVKLPTSKSGRKVAVNAENDNIVYFCALSLEK